MSIRYLIGIDEAGRGPLAGPVAVGAVLVPIDFDWKLVHGAKDSKQMTESARASLHVKLQALQKEKQLRFAVSLVSSTYIDSKGIVSAIKLALSRAIFKLDANPKECRVLLDGGLYAPEEFDHQETIIRGDDSEPVISLASIAAKVTRDKYMKRLSTKYPQYGFEIHKGYGTAMHRDRIRKNGLSDIHRETFCSAFT